MEFVGGCIGNVIAMPVAGVIAASPVGWPLTFYVYGSLGLCWCILWFFLGSSCPSSSKWITEEERKWIESDLGDGENRKVR